MHRIIINGIEVEVDHGGEPEGGGNRTAEPTTIDQVLKSDHAPSEIVIRGLNLEEANKVLKLVKKLTKK